MRYIIYLFMIILSLNQSYSENWSPCETLLIYKIKDHYSIFKDTIMEDLSVEIYRDINPNQSNLIFIRIRNNNLHNPFFDPLFICNLANLKFYDNFFVNYFLSVNEYFSYELFNEIVNDPSFCENKIFSYINTISKFLEDLVIFEDYSKMLEYSKYDLEHYYYKNKSIFDEYNIGTRIYKKENLFYIKFNSTDGTSIYETNVTVNITGNLMNINRKIIFSPTSFTENNSTESK